MGPRLEIKLARLAFVANDHVVGLATAGRHVGPREVAEAEHQVVEPQLDFGELLFGERNLIAKRAHLKALGLALLRRHAAEFLRFARTQRAHLVEFMLNAAPLGVAFNY